MCGVAAFDSPPAVEADSQPAPSSARVSAVTTTSTTIPPPAPTLPSTTSTVPEPVPEEPEAPDQTAATIVFGGDILIHSTLRARAVLGGDAYDFRPMLEQIRPAIVTADLAICHLEVALTSSNTDLSTYPRFNAPHEVASDPLRTAAPHRYQGGISAFARAEWADRRRGFTAIEV